MRGSVRPSTSRSLSLSLAQLGASALGLGGVVVALIIAGPVRPVWVPLLFPLVAWVYVAAGLIAWLRRPSNRTGALMTAGGFVWLAAALVNTAVPALVAVGQITATVPLAITIHLLHAFPSGRLPSAASRASVLAVYAVTLVLQAPLYLFRAAPSPENLLTVADRPDLAALGANVQTLAGAAVVLASAVILASRLRSAEPEQRRVLAPLYSYGIGAVVFIPISANVLAPALGLGPFVLVTLQLAALAGVPVAFTFGVLRGGFARTGEIEELGAWLGTEGGTRPALADALAATLGDPSLELVYWVPDRDRYVDPSGRWVELPPAGSRRTSVEVELAGRRVGAIVYDATLIADPELVRRAGRVVAIAVDHERLTADLRSSRQQLRRSRARIVQAGDNERLRIARDLHDGLQVQLVLLALKAHGVAADPSASPQVTAAATQLRSEIDAAAAELRRIVHGVMPALLIERGLFAATEDLVDRMPLPTTLELDGTDGGLPPTVQSTAYFVLSEGLTNAVKHSQADRLTVRVARADGHLSIRIHDDGVGGAVPAAGSGLRSLADRLDVLGGTLHLQSSAGHDSHGTSTTRRVP